MSIASEITRLQGAKADIKSAIEAKGVTVPSSAKLDTYDDYIAQITGGGGADVSGVTATAGDVITGKDFVNSSGTLVHGSMTNRGAVSGSIDGLTTETYTIQSGYHNGSGTVSLTSDIENALDVILNGKALISLSVSGSWTNSQFVGSAPDTTGLSFTANYNNGDTATVTPSVSPLAWSSLGSQTATFSYTSGGVTKTTTKTATVLAVVPASISVSGSWTKTQYTNTAMDTTGLAFTVTYNNGSTQTVTPVKSPSTWGSSAGTQTATFSYTENGTTVTTTKTATVVAITLSSLAVSGSWTNTQYTGQAPDITGLSFTATYNNGNTVSVSPSNITVSPSVWGSTAGTQTATFSYTSGGVTKSTTKTASVEEPVILGDPVGGIIFYIDSTADGTYTFYNANGVQVSAPTVGTDCTGWTYEVTGASKDKYYVVYDQLYASKTWGGNGTQIGASGTAVGTGRSNTTTGLSSVANVSGSIWETIQSMRTNKTGGCDDWFVGSKDEFEQLRLSDAGNSATWFSDNFIWSSSENSATLAWIWFYPTIDWRANRSKNFDFCVCGVRAF